MTTAERVKQVIAGCLGLDIDEICANTNIVEDLGADSLDAIEIQMAIEEEFYTAFDDADAEKIKTVQDYIDHIERQRRQ